MPPLWSLLKTEMHLIHMERGLTTLGLCLYCRTQAIECAR
jgi:hypothetical protein